MFHTRDGLRLTPAYDLVAVALYPEYHQLALAIGSAANLSIDAVRPKHLIALAEAFGLEMDVALKAIDEIGARRGEVEKAVLRAGTEVGAEQLGNNLLELMERRWNGSFASTGHYLSKKQSGGDGT